jgi:hypothetical protein
MKNSKFTPEVNTKYKAFIRRLKIYFFSIIIVIAIRVLILYIGYKYTNPYHGLYNIVNPGSIFDNVIIFNLAPSFNLFGLDLE